MSKSKSSPGSNGQCISNSVDNFECIELARNHQHHHQSLSKLPPSSSSYNRIDNLDGSFIEIPSSLNEVRTKQSVESSAEILQDVRPKKKTKVRRDRLLKN